MIRTRFWLSIALVLFLTFGVGVQSGSGIGQDEVEIFGVVGGDSDLALRPFVSAWLGVFDSDFKALGAGKVDSDGSYSVSVPRRPEYVLTLIPYSGGEWGYLYHGYMPQWRRVNPGSSRVEVRFNTEPSFDLLLKAYDGSGHLLTQEGIGARTKFTVDMSDRTSMASFSFVPAEVNPGDEDAPVTSVDLTPAEEGLPTVSVPLGEERKIMMTFPVPNFGTVLVMADNEGQGYSSWIQGLQVLNLNYEFARSQVRRLKANMDSFRAGGGVLSTYVLNKYEEARNYLNQAMLTPDDDREMAKWSDLATSASLWGLEQVEQEKAMVGIEVYRKGDAILRVVDSDGKPVAGARVTYTQTSRDFLFGVGDYVTDAVGGQVVDKIPAFELMRQAGINHATALSYWNVTEPEPGLFHWDLIEKLLGPKWLKETFSSLRLHALVYIQGMVRPDFIETLSFPALKEAVRRHVSEMVAHYGNQVDIWEAMNEGHDKPDRMDLTVDQMVELAKISVETIKRTLPDAKIVINNNNFWGKLKARGFPGLYPDDYDFTLNAMEFMTKVVEAGVPVDYFGHGLYNGGFSTLGRGRSESTDLATISSAIDAFSRLGKPVYLSEVSFPSKSYGSDPWAGAWRGEWNEEVQAEILRQFYTIAFGKPRVMGITWWSITDHNSWLVGGGLLDDSNRPKLAYHTLKRLLSDWTTAGDGETDGNGEVHFRGFGGEYLVSAAGNAGSISTRLHVTEQSVNEHTLELKR